MRGDLDSSLEMLDDAIDMVQELNEEEENTDNSSNDVSNGNGLEVESGNDETINDNGVIRGGIIDDNVERSQECVQNAKPGEVCALS
jgi:hypothetical protein